MAHQVRRNSIREDTSSAGVGPLSIDVDMARKQGWSAAQLERTFDAIAALARREHTIAHRRAPLPGCSCIHCDTTRDPRKGCGRPSCRDCYLPATARRMRAKAV